MLSEMSESLSAANTDIIEYFTHYKGAFETIGRSQMHLYLIGEVKMKSNSFVVIQGWMCNELNLKGNELLVFALIYGFSQDNESFFTGSRKYIADTFNISLPTVDKALSGLVEKNLIVRDASEELSRPVYYVDVKNIENLIEECKETLHSLVLSIL